MVEDKNQSIRFKVLHEADDITTIKDFHGLTLDIARINQGSLIGVWLFLTNGDNSFAVRYGINTSTKLAEMLANDIVYEFNNQEDLELN